MSMSQLPLNQLVALLLKSRAGISCLKIWLAVGPQWKETQLLLSGAGHVTRVASSGT